MSSRVEPGDSFPLGATLRPDGVNFCVYSRHADLVQLVLFDSCTDAKPGRVISLKPGENRTYHYWHVFVPGLKAWQSYAYRAFGPFSPEHGKYFDPEKLLLDPYAKAIYVPPEYDRDAAKRPGDNSAFAMKSVVVNFGGYNWEGDKPLHRPFSQTIIYEMHVRGFTQHSSSGVSDENRGTYRGLIEKIPYLERLGITAVELLPVYQFDSQDAPEGLINYWGYSPISFFAPHAAYSRERQPEAVLSEFRDMVKAFHRAGIEVILDVVYNHTTEGNREGPTLCYRGLDNEAYYLLTPDRRHYADCSGCGNTMNANHAVVRRMIIDSLRHWVTEMHVDGFRFDLASILSRDEDGRPLANPPVLWEIESDPALAGTKLIAEAWDAAGLYQVGTFVGDSWKEWNGKYRDEVRSFMRGDEGSLSNFPKRFLGSPDLYEAKRLDPHKSINFITSHDGFTLNDLVSYNSKHNEANREGNRDGANDNFSWNCGVEGATDDPQIESLRLRQIKNFLTITLMAAGAPMITMGDEVRRTQNGNNNCYCQDNELSYFDWTLVEKNAELLEFTRKLIKLRLSTEAAKVTHGMTLASFLERIELQWHGVRVNQPDWSPHSRTLAVAASSLSGSRSYYFMFNVDSQSYDFELPECPNGAAGWSRLLDTSLPAPADLSLDNLAALASRSYRLMDHSVVILAA